MNYTLCTASFTPGAQGYVVRPCSTSGGVAVCQSHGNGQRCPLCVTVLALDALLEPEAYVPAPGESPAFTDDECAFCTLARTGTLSCGLPVTASTMDLLTNPTTTTYDRTC